MPGISHEPIRYETPFDNQGWLHVLFGHVPGYQQDYILHPRLPEQGFTGQHLGLLLSHFKSQEPRYADRLAFSIANLKPRSAMQSPPIVALIIAVRIQGAKDPHGRDRPLLAHAIIAVDRQLTARTLREAFTVFTAPFAGRPKQRQERPPQGTHERPIDSWYHEYQAAHASLLGDPAAQLRFLGQYVRRFAGLPALAATLAPTPQTKEKGTQPTAAPPFHKRVTYIDYPDDATTLQLGTWATELACVLAGSSLPWSSVQFGGQPPGLSLPPVENGLTVQFIPEHERVPQYAETDRISHDRFLSAQAQEQLGSLFGLDVQPPPQRGEDQGPLSFSSGQHCVPSDSGDPLSSSADDSSDPSRRPSEPQTPVTQPPATEPIPSPASPWSQFPPPGPLPTARTTSTVAPIAPSLPLRSPDRPPAATTPPGEERSLLAGTRPSRFLLALFGLLMGYALREVQLRYLDTAASTVPKTGEPGGAPPNEPRQNPAVVLSPPAQPPTKPTGSGPPTAEQTIPRPSPAPNPAAVVINGGTPTRSRSRGGSQTEIRRSGLSRTPEHPPLARPDMGAEYKADAGSSIVPPIVPARHISEIQRNSTAEANRTVTNDPVLGDAERALPPPASGANSNVQIPPPTTSEPSVSRQSQSQKPVMHSPKTKRNGK